MPVKPIPLLLACLSTFAPGAAFSGACTPTNGTHLYIFDFQRTFTDPAANAPGTHLDNAYEWNLGGSYPGICSCSGSYQGVYYTSKLTLAPGVTKPVNSQPMQFYKLNRNIQVAAELFIGGGKQTFFPLPLTSFHNGDTRARNCGSSTDYVSGSQGRLHLMIDHPFVGVSTIPRIRLIDLYGTTNSNEALGVAPMASVFMSGSVTVPQNCQLAPGQNTTIDFGRLATGELALPGETPQRRVQRSFQIHCTNISESVGITISLESPAHPQFPDLIATNGRSDLGIRVRNADRNIHPVAPGTQPGQASLIPLTLDYVSQRAQFDLEAFPVRTTMSPTPGTFKGYATLKFDFD
ncbi:TPA: fimbrial protein [Pseudomonas aeruginosa]